MAGPTSDQRALVAETEHHAAALDELLKVYELAMENALKERRPNRRLIATLAGRIEYTAAQLLAVQARRTALKEDLQAKAPA